MSGFHMPKVQAPASRRRVRIVVRQLSCRSLAGFSTLLVFLFGCSNPLTPDALIVTQCPRSTGGDPQDLVDVRYPTGSRVVIAHTTAESKVIRVLSRNLSAAGGAVVSPDAKRIVFAGKLQPKGDWQIYEASSDGIKLKLLTSTPGGCMDPAILPNGTLVFVSPVPKIESATSPGAVPRLYLQLHTGKRHQLTFGSIAVSSPTVLADGRILFVGTTAGVGSNAPSKAALYTVNSDGTELSAFAGQHDKPIAIQRPTELADSRIVFLTSRSATNQLGKAEFVSSAAPFRGRKPLFPGLSEVRSVKAGLNGDLLVCAPFRNTAASMPRCALFRLNPDTCEVETPILDHEDWEQTEAIPAVAIHRPMGRLSTVDLTRDTGQILCLNARQAGYGSSSQSHEYRAERIRVFTQSSANQRTDLGEVQLQADGSFMAEVPADVPLGFEAMDEQGNVIRRDPPLVWVRPGENRACVGCHEPHYFAPHNKRPLAVGQPVPRLLGMQSVTLAQKRF